MSNTQPIKSNAVLDDDVQAFYTLCRSFDSGQAPHNIDNTNPIRPLYRTALINSVVAKGIGVDFSWSLTGVVETPEDYAKRLSEDPDTPLETQTPQSDYIDELNRHVKRYLDDDQTNLFQQGNANGQLLAILYPRGGRVIRKVFYNNQYAKAYNDIDEIVEVKTFTEFTRDKTTYTLISTYRYDEDPVAIGDKIYMNRFSVEHRAFKRSSDKPFDMKNPGEEVPLSTVPQWAAYAEPIFTERKTTGELIRGNEVYGIQTPLFCEWQNPQANEFFPNSKDRLPIAARAIGRDGNGAVRAREEHEANTVDDFAACLKILGIPETALKTNEYGNKEVPKRLKGRLIPLKQGSIDGDMSNFQTFAPTPNAQANKERAEDLDREIDKVCELSEGTCTNEIHKNYRNIAEIKHGERKSQSTEDRLQGSWRDFFIWQVAATAEILRLQNVQTPEEYVLTIDFGDGLTPDKQSELAENMQLEGRNAINAVRLRALTKGITLQQAVIEMAEEAIAERRLNALIGDNTPTDGDFEEDYDDE
jgi:hypothetical protein